VLVLMSLRMERGQEVILLDLSISADYQ